MNMDSIMFSPSYDINMVSHCVKTLHLVWTHHYSLLHSNQQKNALSGKTGDEGILIQ